MRRNELLTSFSGRSSGSAAVRPTDPFRRPFAVRSSITRRPPNSFAAVPRKPMNCHACFFAVQSLFKLPTYSLLAYYESNEQRAEVALSMKGKGRMNGTRGTCEVVPRCCSFCHCGRLRVASSRSLSSRLTNDSVSIGGTHHLDWERFH